MYNLYPIQLNIRRGNHSQYMFQFEWIEQQVIGNFLVCDKTLEIFVNIKRILKPIISHDSNPYAIAISLINLYLKLIHLLLA